MTKDLTSGNPFKIILLFTLPLMLGNLLQQMYNIADTWVVGRFLGADALAAVGSTGNINACLFLLLAGLATGVSVIVSQYWGAERYDELRRLLGTFLTLLLAASVVMSLLGVLLAEPMLRLLQVPENRRQRPVRSVRQGGRCAAGVRPHRRPDRSQDQGDSVKRIRIYEGIPR
mgnify:CR=1 FL=1